MDVKAIQVIQSYPMLAIATDLFSTYDSHQNVEVEKIVAMEADDSNQWLDIPCICDKSAFFKLTRLQRWCFKYCMVSTSKC